MWAVKPYCMYTLTSLLNAAGSPKDEPLSVNGAHCFYRLVSDNNHCIPACHSLPHSLYHCVCINVKLCDATNRDGLLNAAFR